MLDAVLLEWDGVLTDTGLLRGDALRHALDAEGVPLTDAVRDACRVGLDVRSTAAAAVRASGRDDATLAEIVALRATRALAQRLADGFSLVPGATALVTDAAARTRVAIVTQMGRTETEMVLRLTGLGDSVQAVFSTDDVTDVPPSPMLFARALDHLARLRPVRADRVVAVLQSVAAIRSARAAGVRTLAVGAPAHVAAEADGAIDDVRGLSLESMTRLTGGIPAPTIA